MDNATKPQTYNSISEIRERKEAILAEMRKDNADIGKNGKLVSEITRKKEGHHRGVCNKHRYGSYRRFLVRMEDIP